MCGTLQVFFVLLIELCIIFQIYGGVFVFFEQLRKLCASKNISVTQLVLNLGISKSNVTNWKNGINPKSEVLKRIADYFNVSVDYLLGNIPNAIPYNDVKKTLIPIVGRVAAGLSCLAEENIEGYEYAEDTNPNEKYIYLRVQGDSMSPKIEQGDLALIRCQTSIDSGKIAVVIVNGDDGVIKKVVYGDDWIELHSVNPYYPVRRFEGADVELLHIVGLVMGIKRKFEE